MKLNEGIVNRAIRLVIAAVLIGVGLGVYTYLASNICSPWGTWQAHRWLL